MSDSATTGKLEDSAVLQLSGIIIMVLIVLLFVLVIIVIFFRLFTRRHRYWISHTAAGLPTSSLELPTLQHQGLDPSILKSIKVVQFCADELELECSVCLCNVSEGEKACFLPKCNHGFHMQCIHTWFQSHSTCPLCRNTVSIDSPAGVSLNTPPNLSPSSFSSSSSSSSSGVTNAGHLAIDISIARTEEENHKSPVTPTAKLFRSLSRLLSRDS